MITHSLSIVAEDLIVDVTTERDQQFKDHPYKIIEIYVVKKTDEPVIIKSMEFDYRPFV